MKNLSLFAKIITTVICCLISEIAAANDYGNDFGAPQARISSVNNAGKEYYSGAGLSIAPMVTTINKSDTKMIRLDITHKIIDLGNGTNFSAWTFGNEVPAPIIHVRKGDKIIMTINNRSNESVKISPPSPHSIELHAGMLSPQDKYRSIQPGQSLTFTWYPNFPGVFMYHCGNSLLSQHIAKGMYGMIIVEPRDGYPTKVEREYALIQSEFYLSENPTTSGSYDIDLDKLGKSRPTYVVFNGKVNRHIKERLRAKPRERVRLFVLNAGPRATSNFHVTGTIFDHVYVDGNPANDMHGIQTVTLGPSSGAVIEFVIPESGEFNFIDHEFVDAEKGAEGIIDATGRNTSTATDDVDELNDQAFKQTSHKNNTKNTVANKK